MPKLSWNKFIEKHLQVVGIEFVFADYERSKRALQKIRASKKVRIVKTAKALPTPNALITKLAVGAVKGDYTIKSEGSVQTLLFADQIEAKALAAKFKTTTKPTTPDPPCKVVYQYPINMDEHQRLATKHGLY